MTGEEVKDSRRIGVDLGGTAIKVGAVQSGQVLRPTTAPTPQDFRQCVETMATLAEESGNGIAPDFVGVGVPGVVDRESGMVLDAPNLPFMERQPLVQALGDRLGAEVRLENDATAAALGEAVHGAGRSFASFLLATLGTGIGGGLYLKGELWRGEGGMAGEFGHLPTPHERICGCGARGCLEAAASATNMLRWAQDEGIRAETLPELAEMARRNDPRSQSHFRQVGTLLGEGFAQVSLLLDIRVFVVGGGGAPVLDLLHDSALQTLTLRAFGRDSDDFQILPARLGNQAGILGAAELGEGA